MNLTEHPHQHAFAVREVSEEGFKINDALYAHSVLITAAPELLTWHVANVEQLTAEALAPLLSNEPEVIIIGTGAQQHLLAPALFEQFYAKGVGVEVMNTQAAARTYNILAAEERRVAAGLILP